MTVRVLDAIRLRSGRTIRRGTYVVTQPMRADGTLTIRARTFDERGRECEASDYLLKAGEYTLAHPTRSTNALATT